MTATKKDAASENQKRREQAQKQQQQRARKAKTTFEHLSNDAQSMKESLLVEYLVSVLRVKSNSLDDAAVQMVMEYARKKQGSQAPKGYLEKSALLEAIDKYGDYLVNSKKVNEIFNRFDTNKDGVLSRKELWNALKEHEQGIVRHNAGRMVVTEEDLEMILQRCDADNSGKVSRDEILPAIAAWEELVSIKVEQQQDCCIIL
jgi:Ca2+-binding EF-hand superfamily protein